MLLEQWLELAEAQHPQVIAWRRYLHQHPELSFKEASTALYIEETLRSFGKLTVSRPTPTSVMARLTGKRPGVVLAIRADIDALPIQEETDLPFASNADGVMHACGHDGHTAIALGVAKLLTDHLALDELEGEVRFIFQHAEELPPGGAEDMIAAGVLDGVDYVIGAHLQSPVEVGKVGVVAGPMLASPDNFTITIKGKGGHAAEPHRTVDSIAIGAQVVTNLQHLASRHFSPVDPLVVSVTKFAGGQSHNVIPGSAELCGTVRCIDPELREEVPRRMEQIVRGITEAHGAEYELQYTYGYRPLINNKEVTAIVAESAAEVLGEDALYTIKPSMAADDMSAYIHRVPGTYFNIGAGNKAAGIVYPHHHSRFTIDEDSMRIGVKVFIASALRLMKLR
ncbi:amidohydrolase [Paenibacillus radicis (ex Gao et al. 2016)]|uniref:N-acyl-L-amino acid amidohydrolase n=1 Tax=Paenibacillus radicis (ex Gao et al. 2016) TaxID=1737354 RepID=A0A917HAZ9_9BACL|nr:amidohydrolase [Paenibacillus radicis (ex Gao et al. 2016)]GGG73080.1 N-acyl-L-amino acid amidohydrolase [Paenibacillus radicis (ex Gao et al. 2016)]